MPQIAIETLDHQGSFNAWLAEPVGTPKGAIVVIQEIFGVNPGIRAKCDHWAGLGYLGMLCVSPTRQSGGLGRRLLDAAEDHGRAIGIAAMEMTVIDSRESLIAWYVRRGYAFTGETRPFHELRPADAETGPQITFVVLEKAL